ncbi:MAG: hypothetical protein IJT50_04160 [Lentisphaeria bacterium]|nr:hypothetical protein [Lentisphaeria bacterium]
MNQVCVGAAENVVEVPLFAELGGYGPFKGRRNIGVRDPLYCRVLTVSDGVRRNVLVITDMIATGQLQCRLLRAELAEEFSLFPDSIMFGATHTHSGACISSCDVGYGEPSAEFTENWRRTVKKTVQEALRNEEPVRAFAGKAPIRKPIGSRRTMGGDKHTDPEIRFVKFCRGDGSVKVLLHNHAMHGVVFGPQLRVSADWMGDANAKIKARKMAEMPLFVYGTAGDVNVIWTHSREERDKNLEWIGASYTDDLQAALDHVREISLGPVESVLKSVELPTEPVCAEQYRETAEQLLVRAKESPENEKLLNFIHDRMIEMAVLAENGHDFRLIRDFQVLRMGDFEIFAIPGEAFLAIGEELMARSKAAFPIALSVANGDAGYFPDEEMFAKYPNITDCDDFGAFGFYEVWFGPGQLRAKFKPGISKFIVEKLLEMEPAGRK